MNIAILLYEGVTALDAVGPYEVLSRIPGVHIDFVAVKAGPVRTDTGFLELVATATISDDQPYDAVIIPGGGVGARRAAGDTQITDWIRDSHAKDRYLASVCTGALILARAGVLRGIRATTHWSDRAELEALGVEVVDRRIVETGRIITSAGVSAGIDMALALADRLTDRETAEAIQLILEYDPDPPFSAGSPRRARRATIERATQMMRASHLREEGRTSIRGLDDQSAELETDS
jgi:transcriptional regulator GlxA family with amidase domain